MSNESKNDAFLASRGKLCRGIRQNYPKGRGFRMSDVSMFSEITGIPPSCLPHFFYLCTDLVVETRHALSSPTDECKENPFRDKACLVSTCAEEQIKILFETRHALSLQRTTFFRRALPYAERHKAVGLGCRKRRCVKIRGNTDETDKTDLNTIDCQGLLK